jgi:hypothetical protein
VNIIKSTISFTLLLAYLLSFGHSLAPHCEINCDGVLEDEHAHNHEHDHSIDDTDLEHDHHVAHGDHYDEGWIDYLACLFSDVEHHSTGSHSHDVISEENFLFKNSTTVSAEKSQTKAFAVFCSYELIGQKIVSTSNQVNGPPIDFERQFHLSSFARRGPPIYSC